MKAPVSWLREYVDFDDSIDELVDKLTFSGIEVEGVETVGGDFTGIVVGEVISVDPHPNADRLLVLQVDIGEPEPRNIVAGIAAKYSPDELVGKQVVIVANLKPAKLRGVVSEGMLLACGGKAIEGLVTVDPECAPGAVVR